MRVTLQTDKEIPGQFSRRSGCPGIFAPADIKKSRPCGRPENIPGGRYGEFWLRPLPESAFRAADSALRESKEKKEFIWLVLACDYKIPHGANGFLNEF